MFLWHRTARLVSIPRYRDLQADSMRFSIHTGAVTAVIVLCLQCFIAAGRLDSERAD